MASEAITDRLHSLRCQPVCVSLCLSQHHRIALLRFPCLAAAQHADLDRSLANQPQITETSSQGRMVVCYIPFGS